jgi:hypothetical protein
MDQNEPGFLEGTIEARRRSQIPVRAFVYQKGKHPFPKASSDAYAEKIGVDSHRWHTFQGSTFQLNYGSAQWGEISSLQAWVLFKIGGSLIDGGVNFRPPG